MFFFEEIDCLIRSEEMPWGDDERIFEFSRDGGRQCIRHIGPCFGLRIRPRSRCIERQLALIETGMRF